MHQITSRNDIEKWYRTAYQENKQEQEKATKECTEQFERDQEQLRVDFPIVKQNNQNTEKLFQSHIPLGSNNNAQVHVQKFEVLLSNYQEQIKLINNKYAQNLQIIKAKVQEMQHSSPGTGTSERASASMHAAPSSRPMTYITIKCDTGLGNSLWICGNGPKMSWDAAKALPLRCVGTDTWVYETTEPFQAFSFKILLNGKAWETGQDHSIERNKPIEITPQF